jgi:hypothetical protein
MKKWMRLAAVVPDGFAVAVKAATRAAVISHQGRARSGYQGFVGIPERNPAPRIRKIG